MNALKNSMTLGPVIVLFAHGVYCPGIYRPGAHANDLPSNYALHGCESNSPNLDLHSSSSVYQFECSEETPSVCNLIEELSSGETNMYSFQRADVEFISMIEEEMTLIMYRYRMEWSVTCYFTSVTLAQKFYRLITRDRHSELVASVRADYLKNSDDTVFAEPANLYLEGREHSIKIVVKNDERDPVLIFPKDAVSERIQREDDPTKIDLYIIYSVNPYRRVLFKFGFSTPELVSSLNELLN